MKKLLSILLVATLIFSLTGCTKISVTDKSPAILTFKHGDKNITEALNKEETEEIKSIFDRKALYSDSPSCAFSEGVSIAFGDQVFAIACDDCNIVKDCASGKFFSVSEAEKAIIIDIFESHGGYFPCV